MIARRLLLVASAAAAIASAPGGTRADGGADRRAAVVARVGGRAITAGEVEDGIARTPPFQRAAFGATAGAIRRGFLEDVAVRDALLSARADAAGAARAPRVRYEIDRALSDATIRALRAAVGPASAIPVGDVRAYYDEHRARYDAPERYRVWRILCKTRDEARSVVAAALADATPQAFAALARDHSVDKATNMRAGDLGFLDADGVSNEPGLRVDPAIARAAQGVRDGEIVRAPVAEGEYFAVVWRRGTIAASRRSVDEAAPRIRGAILEERVKGAVDALLARLRAEKVRDLDEAPLDSLDLPAGPAAKPRAAPPR